MSSLIDVYCDFDGTITKGDTTDVLLQALAHPSWHDIEDRWERGEIGSRECMAQQVRLIQGGWSSIEKVLEKVEIEPTFIKFANWCRRNNVGLKVVSDGIDRVIQHILKRAGFATSNVWANHLVENADGSLELTFPHAPQVQGCGSGVCKCKILALGINRPLKVVIGDGQSDYCWAQEADMVFAKTKLLAYCHSNNIHCVPFADFTSIRAVLEEKLEELRLPEPALIPGFAQAG
jgi:2,3-diketo-5-methylthio-1-phosphopentane phosphatase